MQEKIIVNNPYLQQLKQLILNYIADKPVQIFLYGSRARNTARKTSDVDIALLSKDKLPEGFITNLREIIEESTIPYQVDIIDLNQVDDNFRQKILKEAKLWNV